MYTISSLEKYFSKFRSNVIGQALWFDTPFGPRRLLYADWTASGRAYQPIEKWLQEEILPFFGNTHTEATITGMRMSAAYEEAKLIAKTHVHAREEDVLIFCGTGMTAAVNKLQRIIGLKGAACSEQEDRPLVLVTHMEHHSNQISWLETAAKVVVVAPDEHGSVDPEQFREVLERHRGKGLKIAAVTACSNVSGIVTPYQEIARVMHEYGGVCFVDFACSAPYVEIDMHSGQGGDLDAIYFSGHKFLGGPGTPGVLVFNQKLYANAVPDQPGGGTLLYSSPWGGREYVEDIEAREDGGTPPILQAIKLGRCIRLKEEMGVAAMLEREAELVALLLERLLAMPGIQVLDSRHRERLGVISFIVEEMHYHDVVKTLNDRFGIQARGGCSCAGTYGHYLLSIDQARPEAIRKAIIQGDAQSKPGWVRLSVHPTMTDAEIDFIADAVAEVAGMGRPYHQ